MSGFTWISYQGYPCRGVKFVRERGYDADVSWVTMAVKSVKVLPASLDRRPSTTASDLTGLLNGGEPAAFALDDVTLEAEGPLELACTVSGEVVRLLIPNLFVAKIETERQSIDGSVKVIRVELVDERFFWRERGLLSQWTFNRVNAGGVLAPDSVRREGQPWTLREIAEERVSAGLFRAPKFSHVPDDWTSNYASRQFPPNGLGVEALKQLVVAEGLEPPCFRLDGTIALHEAGDGFAGTCEVDAAGKASGENSRSFDADKRVFAKGEGQGVTFQPIYPETHVVVRGGQTIQSVAIDDWDPVLMIEGRPFALTEKLVRKLTGGAHGLAWLRAFVLAPVAYQNDPAVGEDVSKLFREQAYRTFRLPGVTAPETEEEGDPLKGKPPKPGPRAHLLPLLPRAETADGKRRPVTVESYTYTTRALPLASSAAQGEQLSAIVALAAARDALEEAAIAKGLSDPRIKGFANIEPETGPGLVAMYEGLSVHLDGTTSVPEELQQALQQAKQLEVLQKIDQALAGEWLNALKKKLQAEDAAKGTASAQLLDIAIRARTVGKTAGTGTLANTGLLTTQRQLTAITATGTRLAAEAQRVIENAKAQLAAQGPRDQPVSTVTHWNELRAVDLGASVLSAELGVIRTTSLAGHLTKPDVRDPKAGGPLIPCPVRVIFGSTLRPRLDVPQKPGGTITGRGAVTPETPEQDERAAAGEAVKKLLESGAPNVAGGGRPAVDFTPKKEDLRAGKKHPQPCPGGLNVIPREVASDQDSYYVAAFKRKQRGVAEPITLASVPLDRASPIERDDLFELVSLNGNTNRALHDETARQLAAAKFRRADALSAGKRTVLGPQGVQCDGVVKRLEIHHLEAENGAPCGLESVITTGSDAFRLFSGTSTVSRRGAGIDAARREGIP